MCGWPGPSRDRCEVQLDVLTRELPGLVLHAVRSVTAGRTTVQIRHVGCQRVEFDLVGVRVGLVADPVELGRGAASLGGDR
jgi:hypothetical protein